MSADRPGAGASPAFSIDERDRRWETVRALMELASLDVLVVPTLADSRYLTQAAHDIGPTIFPLHAEVTLLSGEGRVGDAARHWVRDVRPVARRWADGIISRLTELDANGKIIGVAGLDSSPTHPDGDCNYNTFVWLREAFPRTRWVGATSLLRQVRAIKSPAEVSALERAAAGTDAGLTAAVAAFRPGVADREVWGQAALAAARSGAAPPCRLRVGTAPLAEGRPDPFPTGRTAMPGDVLVVRMAGCAAGYHAPGTQLAVLGELPPEWRQAWEIHLEAWGRAWEILRPGTALDALETAARAVAAGPHAVRLEIRGAGLGDDLPHLTSGHPSRDPTEPIHLQEGMAFEVRPVVEWLSGGAHHAVSWSDTIVLTASGPRRLGARPHAIGLG